MLLDTETLNIQSQNVFTQMERIRVVVNDVVDIDSRGVIKDTLLACGDNYSDNQVNLIQMTIFQTQSTLNKSYLVTGTQFEDKPLINSCAGIALETGSPEEFTVLLQSSIREFKQFPTYETADSILLRINKNSYDIKHVDQISLYKYDTLFMAATTNVLSYSQRDNNYLFAGASMGFETKLNMYPPQATEKNPNAARPAEQNTFIMKINPDNGLQKLCLHYDE